MWSKLQPLLFPLVCLGLLLGGFWLIWHVTPLGIGVSHDSIFYLNTARNIMAGHGAYTSVTGPLLPLTHYPPLFPAVLAFVSLVSGAEPETAARVLNALLLGLNCALLAALVWRYTRGSLLAGLGAGLIGLLSHVLLLNHYMAWSEPLFLLLVLLGLGLLDLYLTSAQRRWLLWASASFGLAILTRYVGLILLPVLGLAVLLLGQGNWRKRFTDAALGVLPAAALTGLWMLRNKLVSASATNRSLHGLGLGPERVAELKHTMKTWMFSTDMPNTEGFHLILTVLAVAVVCGIVLFQTDRQQQTFAGRSKAGELFLLFGLLYLAFLLASVAFVDATTPLDNRMLAPFFVALVGVLCSFSYRWAQQTPGSGWWRLLVLLLFFFWARHLNRHSRYFRQNSIENGEGFTQRQIRANPVVGAIRQLPAGSAIFADGFDYLYLHYLTQRPIRPLPELGAAASPAPGQPVYAAYLTSCCPEGQAPQVPAPFRPGAPLLPGQLYPLQAAE